MTPGTHRIGTSSGSATQRIPRCIGPWPGQPDPTRGRDAHQAESEAFFKSIENHLENDPYKVMFGSGDWTCTIARWKGRRKGHWKGLDGKGHPATNKPFEREFGTVARR